MLVGMVVAPHLFCPGNPSHLNIFTRTRTRTYTQTHACTGGGGGGGGEINVIVISAYWHLKAIACTGHTQFSYIYLSRGLNM